MQKKHPKLLESKEKEIQKLTSAYAYLGSKDRHLVRLFHWISTLTNLHEEIRASGSDKELEDDISNLINRLTHEVGIRMVIIFPAGD